MKDLKHLIYFEDLLQSANNELVQQAQKEGKLAMSICEKVNKMLLNAYKNKEEAYPGKMRHRAIVWSCPAHYYANFSNWAANCWGIDVLVEMESLNFTKHLETSDKEEAMRDLARLYERMSFVMMRI